MNLLPRAFGIYLDLPDCDCLIWIEGTFYRQEHTVNAVGTWRAGREGELVEYASLQDLQTKLSCSADTMQVISSRLNQVLNAP